jgi:hypothetical protein
MARWMAIVLVLVVAELASAQVKITESRLAYWTGFENPQIVNGAVVASVSSRPRIDHVETTINVETVVPYKFSQMKARRIPDLQRVSLDEVSPNVYRFKSGTPAGKYVVEFSAFDPERGIASEETLIELTDDRVEPFPVDELSVLSREARKAMAEYVNAMAHDMDLLAAGVKDFKTVEDASKASNTLDAATRSAFKQAMANVMAPRLGTGQLPGDAAAIFREIGSGFRSLAK